MAALDFPAAPVNGATFTGANGVTYTFVSPPGYWMASGTGPPIVIVSDTPPASPGNGQHWFNSELCALFIWYDDGNTKQWVPASPSSSVSSAGGDFMAGNGSFSGVVNTDAPITFAAVTIGNTTNSYSTTTGRYTPPPGRFFLHCTYGCQAPAGSNGTWSLVLYKNGAVVPYTRLTASGGPQFSIPIAVGVEVEANGTDYFQWFAQLNAAGMANQGGNWVAYPLGGQKGPTGDIGAPAANFNVRATTTDTLSGPNNIPIFRATFSAPVKDYDPDNVWDLANARFSAPSTGRYQFRVTAYMLPAAAAQCAIFLRHMTAGNVVIRDYADAHQADQNGYGSTFHVSHEVQMATGERVQFLAACAAGTSCPILSTGGALGGVAAGSQLTYASGRKVV